MTAEAPPRIRPGWVWGIFLFYVVSTLSTVFIHLLRATGWHPPNPEMERVFAGQTWVDWGLSVALMALQLGAAILLWLLRRPALWLFMVAFFLGGANVARQLVTRDLASVFTNMGVIGVITLLFSIGVGLMLSAAILAYVWGLYRRGVLG